MGPIAGVAGRRENCGSTVISSRGFIPVRAFFSLVVPVWVLGLAACASAPPQPLTKEVAAKQSIGQLRREAKGGDTIAQVELGRRYGTGKGVTKDFGKALEYVRAAAEKDDADALYYLGTAYDAGAGVDRDLAAAALCYDRAARLGHPDAAYNLAMMIVAGQGGILPSWPAAFPWLKMAAEKGLVKAEFLLGNVYATGAAGEKDFDLAGKWYRKAIADTAENKPAIDRLKLLIDRGDITWQPGDPVDPPTQSAEKVAAP